MATVEELTCVVCEVVESDPRLLMDCTVCGAFFHLNPRNDIEGIDCGDVRLGDCDQPVIQFFCNPCLERVRQEVAAQGAQPLPLGFDPLGATGAAPFEPVQAPSPSAPAPPPVAQQQERPRRRFRRIDGP